MTHPQPTHEQRHAATLAHATGLRHAVLALHRPMTDEFSVEDGPECDGCEPGAYAESCAAWPCSTYELARDWPT